MRRKYFFIQLQTIQVGIIIVKGVHVDALGFQEFNDKETF